MKLIIGVVLSVVMIIGLTQYAYADLIIWQVEANPKGTDSGNEWLTVLNTGSQETLSDYLVKSTHGRIATKSIPNITLNNCEYYKVTFSKQAIDNRDELMKLINGGKTIYETPVLKDIKNSDSFWTNPDGSKCSTVKQVHPTKQATPEERVKSIAETPIEPEIKPQQATSLADRTIYEKDNSVTGKIQQLEKENRELKQIIHKLQSQLKSLVAFLDNFNYRY